MHVVYLNGAQRVRSLRRVAIELPMFIEAEAVVQIAPAQIERLSNQHLPQLILGNAAGLKILRSRGRVGRCLR